MDRVRARLNAVCRIGMGEGLDSGVILRRDLKDEPVPLLEGHAGGKNLDLYWNYFSRFHFLQLIVGVVRPIGS